MAEDFDHTEDDDMKVFVSRLPKKWDDDTLAEQFAAVFGWVATSYSCACPPFGRHLPPLPSPAAADSAATAAAITVAPTAATASASSATATATATAVAAAAAAAAAATNAAASSRLTF